MSITQNLHHNVFQHRNDNISIYNGFDENTTNGTFKGIGFFFQLRILTFEISLYFLFFYIFFPLSPEMYSGVVYIVYFFIFKKFFNIFLFVFFLSQFFHHLLVSLIQKMVEKCFKQKEFLFKEKNERDNCKKEDSLNFYLAMH